MLVVVVLVVVVLVVVVLVVVVLVVVVLVIVVLVVVVVLVAVVVVGIKFLFPAITMGATETSPTVPTKSTLKSGTKTDFVGLQFSKLPRRNPQMMLVAETTGF